MKLIRIAYSAAETADMVGVSHQTILAEIRSGRLVAQRVGREYRVHVDTINEYLKCPAPRKQPASISTRKLASGAFSVETAPVAALEDFEAKLMRKLRNVPSQKN
jgi:excisionase family DNA binding protein